MRLTILNQRPQSIVLYARSAPGPRGPTGPPGPTGFNYTQASPSNLWIINHNLGYQPVVDVYTVGGVTMIAEVIHTTLNQVQIGLVTPQSGSARFV